MVGELRGSESRDYEDKFHLGLGRAVWFSRTDISEKQAASTLTL
jgi:hypothetical protein